MLKQIFFESIVISTLNATYENNNVLLKDLKEKSEYLRQELDRLNNEYNTIMGKVTSQNNEISKEVNNISNLTSQILTTRSNISNAKPKMPSMGYNNSMSSDNIASSFQINNMGGGPPMSTPNQNDFETNSMIGYETPKSSFPANSNDMRFNNIEGQGYNQTAKVTANHSIGGTGQYNNFNSNSDRQSRAPPPYQSFTTNSEYGSNSNRESFGIKRQPSIGPNTKEEGAAHSYAEMQQRIFDMEDW